MGSSYATRSTHSIEHEKSFLEAVKSINQAVKKALPSKTAYDRARVLSLRWENDDLGLAGIEAELLEFFRVKFHYGTDSLLIPSSSNRDAFLAVRGKLSEMIAKYDTPTSLLIIIYEGHSSVTAGPGASPLTLHGAMHSGVSSLPWAFVEAELATICHADTLIFLDSCFSTAAAMGSDNHEYLAASALESPATELVGRSLTRRFIDLLKVTDGTGMTVAQIHAKLVKGANQPDSELFNTPVHVASAEKPSITLRPIRKLPREVASLNRTGELADGKVLVSILLDGKTSIPSVDAWKKWLTSSIPEAVADIRIEAVFETNSSFCLVTMPVAVWDMLKRSEAYSFVAYVESHNLLLDRPGPSGVLESRVGNVQLPAGEK